MTRVTWLIHNAGKYLLISIYPLPTHPTHNFTHKNGGNLDTLPGWPKKLHLNRPARCAGQRNSDMGRGSTCQRNKPAVQVKCAGQWWFFLSRVIYTRVTLYTAGHSHTAVPHCSHSRAPILHTAVTRPREKNEHGCVYLRCRAVCKLPGCVEGHPWYKRFSNVSVDIVRLDLVCSYRGHHRKKYIILT